MFSSPIAPPAVPVPQLGHRSAPPAAAADISSGLCNIGASRQGGEYLQRWRRHALSKPSTQDYSLGLIHNGLPVIEWPEKIPQLDDDDHLLEFPGVRDVWQMTNEVKRMLSSMGDGEISASAYDTAWVALVPALDGNGGPQFPSTLQWIAENQLPDGSWGDEAVFNAHDRMINTLACVIALKSWSICPERCERGLLFLQESMWRLAEEEEEFMPIGFEVAFPSLMDIAKALGLRLPYEDPALKDIYAKRDLKLKRIPKEVMHKVPTTLLHSLEGMPGLEWDTLLGLQCMDGSFLFSPSATAYALKETRDPDCLKYLQKIVQRFDGGVPNVYPVDLFEHLWAVDRLERLGIARHFEPEIRQCLEYVYRYWTNSGICWARNSRVHDVDDTAMGFRILRLHGYNVSPDVFRDFEKDGEFFCFAGQSTQAVTGLYNLNRASQVMFPGEEILEKANSFSYSFLREKQAANQLLDKWIITKDLPGEVEYALDFPFYASLPRIETRWYMEQYGGGGDVWIGKTLYRMPYVNNDLYLELAKSDFNQCQAIHQLEWLTLQRWHEASGLGKHGVSRKSMLGAYFVAAATVFEPERASERLGWVRTAVLASTITAYFRSNLCSEDARRDFIQDVSKNCLRRGWRSKRKGLQGALLRLLDHFILSIERQHQQEQQQHHHQQHQVLIQSELRHIWEEWMWAWRKEGEELDETGLLLVRTIEICGGRSDPMASPHYARLAQLTSAVCCHLGHQMQLSKDRNAKGIKIARENEIETDMKELVQCVLQNSNGHSNITKQTFLAVAKSYCYYAHCSSATLNIHIMKVLFERVA